jgi:uncharacterized OB-fold protein
MPARGHGRVWSYAVYEHTYHPAFAPPYNVALVELDDGPRVVTSIVEAALEAIAIDMRVEPQFEVLTDGVGLVHFRPERT